MLRLCKFMVVFLEVLLMFKVSTACADYVSHQVSDNAVVINTIDGKVTLTAHHSQAIEVAYEKTGVKQLPSFSLVDSGDSKTGIIEVKDKGDKLTFSTAQLTAVITKSPFHIAYYRHNMAHKQGHHSSDSAKPTLLVAEEQGFFAHDTVRGFRFALQDNEKLLGGGERVLGMDRRGHKFPLYNKAHYGYTTESDQMYFGLPAVMSSNKYILLFDNTARGNMDLGKSEADVMQFDAVGGRTAYVIFAGDSYPQLIKNYVAVTGKQPLPPRWAFGNYASRFGYRTEQEVRDTVNKFKSEDFPLDALVLDLYWFGPDIKGHMGNLEWDKKAFPTPKKMIADLQAQGVNTIMITEPFVLSTSTKFEDAVANKALVNNVAGKTERFDFYFGNTGLIDVFNANGSNWFSQTYDMLYQQGVTGWWGDLGEPEVHPADSIHTLANGITATADEVHNVYGHQWAHMVYEKQQQLNPLQRPFIMMRSGFAGSQRYGMIPWTGDVERSWDGLKPQVELSLQMGLLGMGYTHSDLGGFAGGEKFDAQMYTRWLQYGVFQPVYRPHAQDNIASEPVFHDKTTKDILREFVKLRYRMLPYNYTLAYQNSSSGMPLMRPTFFEDESNLALMDNKDSYFWGDAFLVSPVTEADVKTWPIDLPKGVWFDYWSDKRYSGQQTVNFPLTLKTIPVLVRGGSFIPMIDDIKSTKDYSSEKLTLHYYADSSVKTAQGEMYEDDGKTHGAIDKGLFELLKFDAKHENGRLSINLRREGEGYPQMPSQRQLQLVVHHWPQAPERVQVGAKVIKPFTTKAELDSAVTGAWWDKDNQQLWLKFDWNHQALGLAIW
ncbi:MAG: oligosaccharide 4-alpha-D-glucosyltransferase [Phenylobacterium sp.]|jgi:oligosaccharide 4-alpha-D-glucosyltransferase